MDSAGAPSSEAQTGLVTLGLATFNVASVLLVVLLFAYRRDPELGERLSDLGARDGLTLFALVWASALWATRGALRELCAPMQARFVDATGRGAVWGGRTGALVFLALAALLTGSALARNIDKVSADEVIREGPIALLYFALLASIGSAVAFLAGAAVGLLVAVLDFVMLLLARLAIGR